MKQIFNTLKFIVLLLWQLPQSIIGWLMLLYFIVVGKVKYINYVWDAFVFEATEMSGSISLGTIVICDNYGAKHPEIIQHELGYVKWSKYTGALYLLIMGIPSITWAGLYRTLGYKNYYHFYTEKLANKAGYVEAVMKGNGTTYLRRIKNIF